MVLIEAHIRKKLNVAPVSKRFRDVAHLAIERLENEMANGEGRVIYKDYISIIKRYLIPALANKPIDQIKLKEITEL